MRITCPHCGTRDRREFTWIGAAAMMNRPAREAAPEDWDSYIHLRDNPAGPSRELWYHDPCGAMILAERDTVTHAWGAVQGLRPRDMSDKFTWDVGDIRDVTPRGDAP